MRQVLVFPRVYAIIDAVLLRAPELTIAGMLAEAGVRLIQYRNKRASARRLFEVSRELAGFLNARGVRYVVNDRPDVAALVAAGGVHVGQTDLEVEDARSLTGDSLWIGVSTHTLDQVRRAGQTSAEYIAVGPVFSTATKTEHEPVVGLPFVREARALTRKPLVAIGGITLERAADVFRAGADSVAVSRDLLCCGPPAQRARQFCELAERVAQETR